jgi:hypothetical protein
MNSRMFRVGQSDVFKGAVTAVIAGIITTLYGVVSQVGFDVFSADWGSIANDVIKISFSSFLAYLGKNFLSNEDGDFAGIKV